jgi:hypothetical protein
MPYPRKKKLKKGIVSDKKLGLAEAFFKLNEKVENSNDVIDRLKSMEVKSKVTHDEQVQSFGLENDDGTVVKVTVPTDQAEKFEKAIQDSMREENPPEIAELLFDLKDHIDIVDVVWPEVSEDEEELAPPVDEEGGAVEDSSGDMPDLEEMPEDPTLEDPSTAVDSQSLLVQIIDMMRSDADARKADAEARKAEARTREADSTISQARLAVQQEEDLQDKEAEEKAQNDEQREIKRLAQLNKWRESSRPETTFGDFGLRNATSPKDSEENEEVVKPDATVKNKSKSPRSSKQKVASVKISDVAHYLQTSKGA